MDIGFGIAIAGIWLGVGMIGLKNGEAASLAALFAAFATLAVAASMAGMK